MPAEKKVEIVRRLEESFTRSTLAIFADFRGVSAPEMAQLRQKLREKGIELKVVKNTLASLALDRTGRGEGKRLLEGPISIAFGYDDERAPAQVLLEHIKSAKSPLRIKGAILKERVLTPAELEYLASLPSKEELLTKAVGSMKSPLISLVYVLYSPINRFIMGLKVRMKQVEGG